MSVAYDELIPALKKMLPARTLGVIGRAVSFIQRLRQIRAGIFVWAVVLSRFGHKPGFAQAGQWYGRLSGKELAPRPWQLRFKSASTVRLFEEAFERGVRPWRDSRARRPRHPLARRFPDVIAWDSTPVQVADCLRGVFKGTRSAKAALKATLAVSLYGLLPLFAQVVPGNRHDMLLFPPLQLFRKGTLLLFDKGFVAYERLKEISDAGLKYLCPMRLNGNPVVIGVHRAPARVRKALRRHPDGIRLRELLPKGKHIRQPWDLEVRVIPKSQTRRSHKRHWITTRLVIMPGPKRSLRPYLTNLSPLEWSPPALRELYRLRWQVELVFKELKQHLNLEYMPSKDPHAVQIFAWASLLALALSRTVATCFCPARALVGLAAALRPMLLTRALRATIRLLGRALAAPPREAALLLRVFADELIAEARAPQVKREDSFERLRPFLAKNVPA